MMRQDGFILLLLGRLIKSYGQNIKCIYTKITAPQQTRKG